MLQDCEMNSGDSTNNIHSDVILILEIIALLNQICCLRVPSCDCQN